MKWYFLNTGFHSGRFNMLYDLLLAENCTTNEAYFRLYRWDPYCISLGAHQQKDSVDLSKAERENIDVVKRPTGGRAILHSEEITYSVIMPLDNRSSVKEIYHTINLALIEGLKLYDFRLAKTELENLQPDFRNLYKNNINSLCFAVPAKSEVKFEGRKIIGSAQRKLNNSLLQHGSILCGDFHEKIINYLILSDEEKINFGNEIRNRTITISSILSEDVDYEKLNECLVDGFSSSLNIKFENISENFDEELINQIEIS